MNLNIILQKSYTKQQANEIVTWIGSNQKRFEALLEIFLSDAEYRIVQRAAWPLSYAAVNHPELIKFHFHDLVQQLSIIGKPAAVRRNILRIFDQIPDIPEEHHGNIMNKCFGFISDPQEAIATQAFALGILDKLSTIYPEILPELQTTVELLIPNASPAFKSRGKKILKRK